MFEVRYGESKHPYDARETGDDGDNATASCSETSDNSGSVSDPEVGYCKPPKVTQWKKGQSGNPGGKKKTTTATLKDAFVKTAGKMVWVTDANGKHQMSQFEAVVAVCFQKALKGDAKATKWVMELGEKFIKPADVMLGQLQNKANELGGGIYVITPEEIGALKTIEKLYGPNGSFENERDDKSAEGHGEGSGT
jgi:hypothetical protein